MLIWIRECSRSATINNEDFPCAQQIATPAQKIVTPEIIRPNPKAGPRKTVAESASRKLGDTKIVTDTPC